MTYERRGDLAVTLIANFSVELLSEGIAGVLMASRNRWSRPHVAHRRIMSPRELAS